MENCGSGSIKNLYGNWKMTFKSLNVGVIYRIKILEHSILQIHIYIYIINCRTQTKNDSFKCCSNQILFKLSRGEKTPVPALLPKEGLSSEWQPS